MTEVDRCDCSGESCVAALKAIRGGVLVRKLIDESHFHASIVRCRACSRAFVTIFCERVDWADGDDPQAWSAVPISEREAARLGNAESADEQGVVNVLSGVRRYLVRDMPKGSAETMEWKVGPVVVPGHD